jgi:hypothetical protein
MCLFARIHLSLEDSFALELNSCKVVDDKIVGVFAIAPTLPSRPLQKQNELILIYRELEF